MAVLAAVLLAAVGAHAQSSFPLTTVGTTSAQQSVTLTATAAGTVNNVDVLTVGALGADFVKVTAGSTCTGAALAVNATCTENVTFTPAAPGTRIGAVVLLDAGSNVLGVTYLQGLGSGSLGVVIPGNEKTFAGDGNFLDPLDGDGGAATSAELYLPSGLALDGAGNLYIADSAHHRIRMVCSNTNSGTIAGTSSSCTSAGIITTIAGNGTAGSTGNNGPASAALLDNPGGIAFDGAGNLYVADTGNNEVREIVAATGQIVLVAGGATTVCGGATNTIGDGCPALQATLKQPEGVTLDVNGNLYIADTADARVREVALSSGIITTVAGTGTAGYNGDNITAITAELNAPYAVAFDASGNLYIPDSGNNRVREVKAVSGAITAASTIATYAGTGNAGDTGDGAAATSADLWDPSGVTLDATGNVYIADTQNNAIRKVNAVTGNVSTIAKDGVGTYYDSTTLLFFPVALYAPIGITLDSGGNLYIADSLDMMVRQIQANLTVVDYTTPVRQGTLSKPVPVTVENDGNLSFNPTPAAQTSAQLDLPTTTCIATTPLIAAGDCVVGAVFAPTITLNSLTTNINVTGATVNSPLDIEMVGIALAPNSTTTTISSAPNPSNFGNNVKFTVTVTTGTGTGVLTGSVSIADTFNGATTVIATGLTVNGSGVATFSTSSLAVGLHSIVASYTDDPNHLSSTSTDYSVAPLIQTVNEQTATTLTSSANPSLLGNPVTFTAKVSISGGGGVTPNSGTVTFIDATKVPNVTLGTVSVNNSAVAAYTTSTLTVGVHQIIAVYSGDSSREILGSTSDVLNQDVQAQTTITVTSSLNPSNYGLGVTFTATISSASPIAATGTVAFLDNGTQIGTGTLAATTTAGVSTASFTIATLAVGTHPITATYAGDINNSPGTTAAALNQVVNQAQTSVALTATPNPGVAGVGVAITATIKITAGAGTPTGTVTFTSGTTALGSTTLVNGVAAINPVLAAGTYQIVATYSGDTNDAGSVSAPLPLVVNLGTTATTFTIVPNPAQVVSPVTFTATVTGNGTVPTGTVSFFNGATLLGTATLNAKAIAVFTTSTLAAGTYSVTASYSGDVNNSPSTAAAISLTVGLIPTTTDLTASTTTGSNPQTILTAVVVGTSGPTPTGTVTFTSGTTTIGSGTLDKNGVFILAPTLAAGNYTIVAAYGGDSLHSPSTSAPVTVSTNPIDFTLSVTPTTASLKTSQNVPLTVNLASEGGFTDTIGLGCASLPAGVTCVFSTASVSLAANGTASAQLSIDTNTPIGGGTTAMNNRHGNTSGLSMAGLLLPFSAFFGWLFWRLRKRTAGLFTLVLLIALSAGALLTTGCSGYSSSSATPGTYVIQVTGTGTNSGMIHYQNISLTITK